MSSHHRSLSDATLKDLGTGLYRYRPFILAVAAVVLIVAFLPGTHKSDTASSNGHSQLVAGNGTGPSAPAAGDTTGPDTANAANTGTPGSATANTATAAAGRTAGSQSSPAAPRSAAAPAAPPAPTTDPACDAATGRLKVPSLYSPPCVPPWSGDNGGATYQGVTATTITVARPVLQLSAAGKAILEAGGDNDSDQQIEQTQNEYVDFFEHHFQTYGRKVKLVFFDSAVNPNDSAAAQNSEAQSDATKVAKEIKAFMSLGDDNIAAYEETLVANKVMCICTVSQPSQYYQDRAPFIWGTGLPDETQDYGMRAEMICDEINPFPPKYAGEADLNAPAKQKRAYALMWPQEPSNAYKPGADFFAKTLKNECGVTLADNVGYQLTDVTNPAQAQQEAQTFMAKFRSDGVTSVLFVGDPVTPVYFTSAATRQQYYPEWIQTGSGLTDWAFWARLYDQQQWKHNFGFSPWGDRVPQDKTDAYKLYYWQFQHAPTASSTYSQIYPSLWEMMTGIMLAGPQLTPQTYRCGQPPYTMKAFGGFDCVGRSYPGMFGYPVSPTNWQSRVANAVIAFGDKLWRWDDYNQSDDGTLIWWDPNASGPSEYGTQGDGLYRYMNGGKRYMYGSFPKADMPWFDPNGTVTIFDDLPGPDKPQDYKFACYYLCNSPGN